MRKLIGTSEKVAKEAMITKYIQDLPSKYQEETVMLRIGSRYLVIEIGY